MFTLKLFRRRNGQLVQKTVAVHRVVTMEVPDSKVHHRARLLELNAYHSDQNSDHTVYFVGDPEQTMQIAGERSIIDLYGYDEHSCWGWGLLENWEGNTTEHYRPASYG